MTSPDRLKLYLALIAFAGSVVTAFATGRGRGVVDENGRLGAIQAERDAAIARALEACVLQHVQFQRYEQELQLPPDLKPKVRPSPPPPAIPMPAPTTIPPDALGYVPPVKNPTRFVDMVAMANGWMRPSGQ